MLIGRVATRNNFSVSSSAENYRRIELVETHVGCKLFSHSVLNWGACNIQGIGRLWCSLCIRWISDKPRLPDLIVDQGLGYPQISILQTCRVSSNLKLQVQQG